MLRCAVELRWNVVLAEKATREGDGEEQTIAQPAVIEIECSMIC